VPINSSWTFEVFYKKKKITREISHYLPDLIEKMRLYLKNFNKEYYIYKGVFRLTKDPFHEKYTTRQYIIVVNEFHLKLVLKTNEIGPLNPYLIKSIIK